MYQKLATLPSHALSTCMVLNSIYNNVNIYHLSKMEDYRRIQIEKQQLEKHNQLIGQLK